RDILQRNLLQIYQYRGYADATISLEMATRWTGWNLYAAFIHLAADELKSGNVEACRATMVKMKELLPSERLDIPPQLQHARESLCPE
ncbi:MAG: hypothetical protein NTV06_01960, partial [candidate division Zixibacteria bacterium]|nr:hypothetical protein [candidate division Zixibacteria bacterium]